MSNWFTIEKIDDLTFTISEYKHSEQTHSYLLIGSTCALLIDTGLGIENIRDEVTKLTNLPIKVVTTHVHWDHIGGHNLFNEIYVHEAEINWLKYGIPIPIDTVNGMISKVKYGCKMPKGFDINKYKLYTGHPTGILRDKDIINIGLREIRIIHTPGHSPGHMCFYEKDKGYLYTGDLIYLGTLYMSYPSTNPFEFKQSIEQINSITNISKILPGHNSLNISNSIIDKIKKALDSLENSKILNHGSGIFDFRDFKIQL